MRVKQSHRLALRSPSGTVIAHLKLTPTKDATSEETAPLIEISEADASEHGETTVQLREAERYEYEVESNDGMDLRLRCSSASRRRSLGELGSPDAGLIETGSFCGTLLMELVEGSGSGRPPVASALIDVRSLKLDFRTEYRGMLRRLADELVGLASDSRSSAKAGFRSSFEERTDAGWLQIQIELLRETLDSAEFGAAMLRIVSYPHERLSSESDSVNTDRPLRWTSSSIRQLVINRPRRSLPEGHLLLASAGLATVAEWVLVQRKFRDRDTPENRFVKFALHEFRAFLTHALSVFEPLPGWGASAALARRLAACVETWLSRDLFREVGEIGLVPLGSPVLQRRAGYREVLRWWLRFRTAAELSWEGGEELFRAGQRDVASLYEYWLFFELLSWFCRKCRDGTRPLVEELVEGLEASSPNVRLRKRTELGPFVGAFAGAGRQLNARFTYSRRFEATMDRHDGGSWTRALHPDYTLTFWPEGLTEPEAEKRELLVHVHFDAKYRVENIETLFGAEAAAEEDEELDGNYKRQDLLKMHAYRDAIKRSQGAYVLYPGRSNNSSKLFKGFHEILPGLGAFGVVPDENGRAQGMSNLEDFLDGVLSHLSNRTTAQERLSYHVSEAYALKEQAVPYGNLRLSETDIYGLGYRALPPAEDMVLVAWYRNDAQRKLAAGEEGLLYVRLGRRRGSFHVHPNISRVRHVVCRTDGAVVAPGLLSLREPGFRVYTRSQLRSEFRQRGGPRGVAAWEMAAQPDDEEHIYALFATKQDAGYRDQGWDGNVLMDVIEEFESDARNRLVENLGRTSPYPRIVPLRDLLKSRLPDLSSRVEG